MRAGKTSTTASSRAYGILKTAQTISSEETMHLLSSVRMGVHLGLISGLDTPALNELFC